MTISTGPDDGWTCEGQADLLDELEATPATAWARHAARAGLDRLAAGRALDAGFVAALEAEVVATVEQTGEDAQAALDGVHEGLAQAVPCPACGARGRHGRHSPSCGGRVGPYGPQGPGVVIPMPSAS